MPATLTTANSTMFMSVEALYPNAQRIQGYAADDAFDTEGVENGEYLYGIDGKLSAGFVFNETPLTITLQADSPSLTIFENVMQYERTNRTKLQVQHTITIPDLGKRYDFTNGFMRSYKAPAGKKILQPSVVVFVFEKLQVSPT
jgi:hypothetical protein